VGVVGTLFERYTRWMYRSGRPNWVARPDASPANVVAHRSSVWPSHLIAPVGTWPTPIMAEIAECMAGRPTGDRANLAVMGNLFTERASSSRMRHSSPPASTHAFDGHSPGVDPGVLVTRASSQDADRWNSRSTNKQSLDRSRPFMYGVL
jgi:hypothetical protein